MPPARAEEPAAPKRAWLGKALLAGWLIVALAGLSFLSLGHIAPMPAPGDEAGIGRALLGQRRDAARSFFVHVIYAGCSCTQRLFTHLVQRARLEGADEMVLFVGEDADKRLAAERAGLRFVSMPAAEFTARYGIEAAPLLVAFDAKGRLRYLGGYYNHPSTLRPLDESIGAQVANGAAPEPLPVFGCAVSPRLQDSLDPFGLVYPRR
jgi:hypothetical protein